jgi:phytoene synthase
MQTSRRITRKSASNLAMAFALLPREERDAMSALYAFCRQVDDVADEDTVPVESRRAQLRAWREDVHRACSGASPSFPVNQELQPVVRRYDMPFFLFDELIKGCEMDLDTHRYPGFAELEQYCYRVASVVGLLSLRIFGCSRPGCEEYAIHLGHALQLTNILRDVRGDAERGRIYLPQSVLRECGVDEASVLGGKYTEAFARAAGRVADRARQHYRQARELLPSEDRRALVAAELMGSVYWALLNRIEASGFRVLGPERIRLGKLHKLLLVVRAAWRQTIGSSRPAYGSV